MAIEKADIRAGPPLGRHIAAVALTVGLTAWLTWALAGGLPVTHAVFADVSLLLLCLILMLGAAARLVPRLRPVTPWGRELGIAMFATAMLHVFIITGPNVIDWFGELFFNGIDRFNRMWILAAWLGIGALAYATALAATSNDWSQRFLGRGWKFLQRQAYTLFVLAWLHTAAYLFFRAGHDVLLPLGLFWVATGAAVVAQFIGFGHTVMARRPQSAHRVPPKAKTDEPRHQRSRAVRWLAVLAMWALFVIGGWILSQGEFAEARAEAEQVSAMCDRYNELGRPVMSQQVRQELEEILGAAGGENGSIFEALEDCDE